MPSNQNNNNNNKQNTDHKVPEHFEHRQNVQTNTQAPTTKPIDVGKMTGKGNN